MENNVTREDALDRPNADGTTSPFVRMFEEAEQYTWEERQRNERDIDYENGYQLTGAEERAIAKRGQPPVVYNRIRRKINFMRGLEKQSRRDPKAFPRTPDDSNASQSATDALRFVCDVAKWDMKRGQFWHDLLVPGTGAVMVGLKQDKMGFTPEIDRIPWDRFFYDPHSSCSYFSDASYMGIVTWYDVEKAKTMFPGSDEVLVSTLNRSRFSETYDDKPKYRVWSDYERQRVRVVELFYEENGVWMHVIFTQGGNITDPQPSPYLNEDQEPECPIVAASLYVDRDSNRYGDVRDMIHPQDEINKRRSKGLHFASMRQIKLPPGSTMGVEAARNEAARPDGVFTDDVDILNTNDMAAQNAQFLAEAKAEIDLQGANAALAGKNENDMSGRAILAQQQGGMIEVAVHMDRLREVTLAVYEKVWNRIRQTWTAERWVRVTDDESNIRFVGFNQPVTAGQMMLEQLAQDPQSQQRLQESPEAQQRLALFMQSPQAQQVVEVRNVPAEVDVDIILDEGMDTPTVQAEQFDMLAKIMPGIVNLPPAYAKMLIMASALRDKDKILEELEALNQPNPMAEQQAQIAQAKEVAEIEKTRSETAENLANAERNSAQAMETGYKIGYGSA